MDTGFEFLPAEHRVDGMGQPVCRWCSTKLEESTYIPLWKQVRASALLCPKCDVGVFRLDQLGV